MSADNDHRKNRIGIDMFLWSFVDSPFDHPGLPNTTIFIAIINDDFNNLAKSLNHKGSYNTRIFPMVNIASIFPHIINIIKNNIF